MLESFIQCIIAQRAEAFAEHALLVGISGIDASGKGYIAAQASSRLRSLGLSVAGRLKRSIFRPNKFTSKKMARAVRRI